MNAPSMHRRTLILAASAAAAAAAIIPLREAVAQAESAGGDWMAMVKAQHGAIAKTLDQLVAAKGDAPPRDVVERLVYQLTAHAVAEENVLYPAMATNGMADQSGQLYDEHAKAKIMLSALHMASMKEGKPLQNWRATATKLQSAILQHAKEHEESAMYPKLQEKLDAKQNQLITASYKQQFGSVQQTA